MKKIYLSLFVGGLLVNNAVAQRAEAPYSTRMLNSSNKAINAPSANPKAGVEIWSNDFDAPSDWIIDNDGETAGDRGWTIDGVVDGWWSAAAGINSTSGGNFAELANGDPTASPGTQALDVTYTMTLAASIDIPNLPLNTTNTDVVTLQFQEYGARFNDLQSVQISTLANPGVLDWVTVRDNLGYSLYSTTGGAPYANPEDVSINLTPYVAGNANTVWIRFTWSSNFPAETNPNAWVTYGWYVDDVKILANPNDDLQMWASWIVGENNNGIEYGRTPQDQVDPNWTIGAQVYNNGSNDQTNLVMDADFGSFTSQSTLALLASQDTAFMESIDPLSLAPAVYSGDYSVESALEQAGGPDFGDNVGVREFEITQPSTNASGTIYSVDGINVYTQNTAQSSIGTSSFNGGEDGLILASLYNIKSNSNVYGIRVMLASGTVTGGEIYATIKDTSLFWAGDMTPLYQADGGSATVTTLNVSQGYKDFYFTSPVVLTPGAYFAAVELYSNADVNTIRVRDDLTVAQPFDASVIYIPGDAAYSNGEALAIRLLMGDLTGVDENSLSGVNVYPNPSEGFVTVSNETGVAHTIQVYDMVGNLVTSTTTAASTTLNLTSVEAGMYTVKVSNETGTVTENVVIK